MKHLKRINEELDSVQVRMEGWRKQQFELNSFCQEYLAYLIDEGFSTLFYKFQNGDVMIKIIKDGGFMWSEVKDDFIPFHYMLGTKYEIVPYKIPHSDINKRLEKVVKVVFSSRNVTTDARFDEYGNIPPYFISHEDFNEESEGLLDIDIQDRIDRLEMLIKSR